MLAVALRYAHDFGWRVIPIRTGSKVPDLADWPKLATTDPAVIEDWWTNGHAGAGIGIATGAGSGIFVLDVDDNGRDKLGKDTLLALTQEHGPLPEGPMVVTPGGGWHFYFRWPGFNPRETLGDHLDIRAEGRQVLAPPSLHPNGGTYCWEESGRPSHIEAPEAPEWMLHSLRPAGSSPGREALEPSLSMMLTAGYSEPHIDNAGKAHLTRPGKSPKDGTSATIYPHPDHHVTIWSTSVDGAQSAEPYYPQALSKLLKVPLPVEPLSLSGFSTVPAASITVKHQRWLWRNRLPLGSAVLLAGQEGLGKSTLAVELAAQATAGTLEGDVSGPCSVVYVSAEDSEAHTLVPRLTAAGADLTRVHFVRIDDLPGGLSIPADLPQLSAAMSQLGARLLVLDPLSVHIGDDRTDSHKERDVRRAIAPLAAAMDELQAVAVGIMHWNKAPTTTALDRILGSRAFTAAARAVLGVGIDPSDPDARVVVLVKSNLGPMASAPALAFKIEARYIPDPAGGLPIDTSGVEWLGERLNVRSSDLFKVANEGERASLSAAQDWLRETLADGPLTAQDLNEGMQSAGITASTFRRARESLGVTTKRLRDPSGRRISSWLVCLPGGAEDPPEEPAQIEHQEPDQIEHQEPAPLDAQVSAEHQESTRSEQEEDENGLS